MQLNNETVYKYTQYRWSIPDLHYLLRHYDYGFPIQMEDDDMTSTLYEMNQGTNYACVEAKHGGLKTLDLSKFDGLAERCRLRDRTLFAFINIYCYFTADGKLVNADQDRDGLGYFSHAEHLIIGVNHQTVKLMGCQIKWMTELQWADTLYNIRGMKMPPNLPLHNKLIYKIIKQPQIINRRIYAD